MCHLLALKLFRTCLSFFLLLSTDEDILKNVGKQTVDSNPLTSKVFFFHIMEVNGYLQLFGYQHSSFVLNRKKETHFHVQWNTPWRVPGWDLCCLCRLGKRTLISICQWWVWTALYTPWGWGNQKTPESGEDLPATTCFIMLFCCIGSSQWPQKYLTFKMSKQVASKKTSKSLTFLNHFLGRFWQHCFY